MTTGTRRVLVQEVVSLFELKQGVVEERSAFLEQEDTMPFTCPKEEINAPISLVVHMLRLIVHYLGIKLPFKIFQKNINPYIQLETPNPKLWKNNNKMPLFLDKEDKNFKRFTIGVAMLNYNISYLCYTQGVEIPLSEVANTLQSLMACCHSSKLGV
ncbi:UV radiation resistance protein/autophagy-related protein 14 [Sporodiniella umbellata]|nr:UV radiation resistance protein/autophagy-related protein 14 [Sporodiniella umbellata]